MHEKLLSYYNRGIQLNLNLLLYTADIRLGGSSTSMGMVASAPFGREQSFIVRAEIDLVRQGGSEAFSMPLLSQPKDWQPQCLLLIRL